MSISNPSIDMRTLVKIDFRGFWKGFGLTAFEARFPFLLREFAFRRSDHPDVCFISVFPHPEKSRLPRHATRVLYTGENVRPDLQRFDFAISFHRDVADERHYRIPNYVPRLYSCGLSPTTLVGMRAGRERPAGSRRFCAFVHDNCSVPFRNEFVRRLSRYRRVDCPGKCLNNMAASFGRLTLGKVRFLQGYKFVVAFENCATQCSQGYVTEKLPDGMLAGCVPLYWGDHRVNEDFNGRRFVNHRSFSNMEEMIDRIIAIDRSDELFDHITSQACYPTGQLPDAFREEKLMAFFRRIFSARRPQRPGRLRRPLRLPSGGA